MPAKFKQQNTQRVFLLLGCCCYLYVYFFCVGVIFNIAKYTVVQDVHCWVHSYFHLENWLNKKSRVLKLVNLENCLFIVDKKVLPSEIIQCFQLCSMLVRLAEPPYNIYRGKFISYVFLASHLNG